MRYIIDTSKDQSDKINQLIEEQRYENLNQFVSVAITNQLHIENASIPGKETNDVNAQILVKKAHHDIKGYISTEINISLPVPDERPKMVKPPTFLQLVPFTEGLKEGDNWMWGQFNRIFPVKLALRVLIMKTAGKEWIEFDKFKEYAGSIALDCAEMLHITEKEENRKREEKISAGLPKKIEQDQNPWEQHKSLSRYKDHFIGSTRKRDGKFFGAMLFLKFANLKSDEKGSTFIGITKSGYEFGKLENPVIDKRIFSHNLAKDEIDYYLSHIYKNVPGEFNAFKWILNKINSGIVDLTSLNSALEKEFGKSWNTSSKVINTQRAGLIARITELGLITKEKDGLRVSYGLSERGKTFLQTYQ